ncbi:MAG: hypothetical protein ACUVUG_01655, partial [Candidatus Aminicenantia bacterium]
LLEVLFELIKIESTNPSLCEGGKGEKKIADFVGNYLKNLNLDVFFQEAKPERSNVIKVLKGKGGWEKIDFQWSS